jgi:hypothetical protein
MPNVHLIYRAIAKCAMNRDAGDKRRKIDIVRRILYGSVEPYFGDAIFYGASLTQIGRHLAASRTAGRNEGADGGTITL